MSIHGPVVIDDESGVRVISLNRPLVRNAMNGELIDGLQRAVADIPATTSCVVIKGNGGHFCAGGDRRDGIAINGSTESAIEALQDITRLLRAGDVISLAAVEGWAVGGGAELAFACDLVIAAATSRFWLPEVELGVHATGGATWLLPQTIGSQRANLLTLTGAVVDGQTAQSWGLAAEVTPDGQAVARACDLARRMAGSPAGAAVATKRSLAAAQGGGLENALKREVSETIQRMTAEGHFPSDV